MAENEYHLEPETSVIPPRSDERVQSNKAIKKTNYEMTNKETDKNENADQKPSQSQILQTQLEMQQPQSEDTRDDKRIELSPERVSDSAFNGQRVYKKTSVNNKLTLYLISRDLIVSESKIDKILGILLVDPEYLKEKRVYGQVTLTFRYGREDEEVMGLKFCNEAVMCLAQLYPPYVGSEQRESTTIPLQEALVKKLGPNAHAFSMEITHLAPPSVQLVPAKEYNGAPIGTSYDVRAYVAERADEKLNVKTTVRMGIRVIQRTTNPPLPAMTIYSVPHSTLTSFGSRIQAYKTRVTSVENDIFEDDGNPVPHAAVEKPFILSEGRIGLEAKLDRAIYAHGDSITVQINVTNNSSKSVRRIQVFIVQHVDVCMFSNGKFKNVVALVSSKEGCPIGPGMSLRKSYNIKPVKGSTKNWIALEDSYTKTGATLASTVVCPGSNPDDRNVFAIYVSYYVKVKLLISAMGGEISLKLPFTLMHSNIEPTLVDYSSSTKETPQSLEYIAEKSNEVENKKYDRIKNIESEEIKVKETKNPRIPDVDLIEHYDEEANT